MTIIRRHRIPQQVEEAILAIAAEQPKLGRIRVAAELNLRGLEATPATVRSVWQRHGLQNATRRVAAMALPAAAVEIAPPVTVDDTIAIPAPHEIPPHALPPSPLMTDALIFSVAVLATLDQHTTDPVAAPSTHDLALFDQALFDQPLFAEDAAPAHHLPAETADILPFPQSHSDFLLT
jgi:hypothetical protein